MNNAILAAPPSEEYIEMVFVKPTPAQRGHNERFVMENLHNGTFKKTEGRVGITVGRYKPVVKVLPIEEWENTYSQKERLGYKVISTKKLGKTQFKKITGFDLIADENVRNIVKEIHGYSQENFTQNYTVSVENISPEMLREGKEILDNLADRYKEMSTAAFNNRLTDLYKAVPRRMDILSKHLAKGPSDFAEILAAEQELYENMKNLSSGNILSDEKNILEANGLTWRRVTDDEKNFIVKRLGSQSNRYIDAWAIDNSLTRKRFENFCLKEELTYQNKGISLLFHGSRNENFWRILTTGLTINPKGVVITGKAYGNGTYFAPNAIKSMGYTSCRGSKWAGGTCDYGFLGMYEVATGTRYNGALGCDSSLNWGKLQSICPGAHCTWAESAYSGFQMDEVIVYNDSQSTVKYLVKVEL